MRVVVENLKSELLTELYVWPGNAMSLKYGKETGLDRTATQEQILAWALEK